MAVAFVPPIEVEAQTPDTLRVAAASDGLNTWYARTNRNGSYRIGAQAPFGTRNPLAVLDTVGVDTIDFYLGDTRVKRYDVTKFIPQEADCSTCSTNQDIVDYWNWYKFREPVLSILTLPVTTVQRDSLFNWGPPPVGTRIFNTTIDSPQIRVAGTINWRNH